MFRHRHKDQITRLTGTRIPDVFWGVRSNRAVRKGMRLLALCAVAGTWLLPAGAYAQTGSWSAPVNVSASLPGGWFPDVAADDTGNVHVVWNGNYPDRTPGVEVGNAPAALASIDRDHLANLYYTRLTDGRWTSPIDIAVIWIGHALRSAVTAEATGQLHLTYKGLGTLGSARNEEDLWHTTADGLSASSALAWRSPRRLSYSQVGYFSDIVVDSRKVLHAIWTESDSKGYGLYYAHSSDGGVSWSRRVALDGSELVWWYRAHLKVDAQDRLHAVWEVTDTWGTTRGAAYSRSVDQGETWSTVRFPASYPTTDALGTGGPGLYGPQQPSVGIDGRGNVLIVFREPDTNRVVYQRSTNGSTWSTPAPLPGVAGGPSRPYDVYDMETDSDGHVHLVMVAFASGSSTLALLHSEWDGTGWTSPKTIAGAPPFPEYPKLAIGQGNQLHVVWFSGNRETIDRDATGVWYSTATTSAPAKTSAYESRVVPSEANGRDVKPTLGASRDAQAAVLETSFRGLPEPALTSPGEPSSSFQWLNSLRDHSDIAVMASLIPALVFVAMVVFKSRRINQKYRRTR